MHTAYVTDDDGQEWTVHLNGDYSGDVLFSFPLAGLEIVAGPDEEYVSVSIPFSVMTELVGRYLRDEQISILENVTGARLVESLRLSPKWASRSVQLEQ